ncbi:MAG TPA: hypothetical protein VGO86_03200, partial [Candidatus Dormibacteraeota bacterium]
VYDDASLFERYIQSARLDGTRYLRTNPEIAQLLDFRAGFWKNFREGINPLEGGFWKRAGWAGWAVTYGADIFDFSPWGAEHRAGYGKKFANTMIMDTAVGATTIGASAMASAGAGAAFGSVVPGVGTVAGLAVGLGVGVFMATPVGRDVRNWTVNSLGTAESWTGHELQQAGHAIGGEIHKAEHWFKSVFDL